MINRLNNVPYRLLKLLRLEPDRGGPGRGGTLATLPGGACYWTSRRGDSCDIFLIFTVCFPIFES